MAETAALHVLIGHLDDEFGTQRLPGEILALAPAALAAGHAMFGGTGRFIWILPILPGVIAQSILAIGREEFEEFAACFGGEAGTYANVLQNFALS